MSNFVCDKCGCVNIDCGKAGYKTQREIELEMQNTTLKVKLDKERKTNHKLIEALKRYADPNFYDIINDPLDDGEMISEDYEVENYNGPSYVGMLAQITLKEVGGEK